MVREAAVDLVGKFILHRAELIDKYYEMLLLRILDTGVSVRKRVIKILKDWVSTTNSRGDLNNSEEENSRHSSSRAAKNTQESQKVPKLTINLGPKKPTEHAFFAELDKNSRERDQRRGKKSHKEKHKEKHKKKKKKRYQSDSDSSESGSDIECLS